MSLMPTTGVLSLPPEILSHIGTYLKAQDVPNTRLACAYFDQVFTPFLTHTLNVGLSSELCRYTHLFYEKPFVGTPEKLVRNIKTLIVELDLYYLDSRNNSMEYEPLVNTLTSEICRLQSLEYLHISWMANSSTWVPPKNLGRLETLEARLISVVLHTIQNPLRTLENWNSLLSSQLSSSSSVIQRIICLQELRIGHNRNDLAILHVIKRLMVLNAESLQTLSVSLYHLESRLSFCDLFPPKSSTHLLSLHTVYMYGNILSPSDLHIEDSPYFPNLRHLTIFRPTSTWRSDLSAFWDLLRASDIRLQSFSTTYEISGSLVKYLASFHGLQHLRLDIGPIQDLAPEVVKGLIKHVLPLHAPSLRKLDIPVPCPSFIFNSELNQAAHWPPPVSFPLLEHLSAHAPSDWQLSMGACQDMLQWLERFPVLDQVDTLWRNNSPPAPGDGDTDSVLGKLIGRTGRPKMWRISGPRSLTWKVEPQNNHGLWYFIGDTEVL